MITAAWLGFGAAALAGSLLPATASADEPMLASLTPPKSEPAEEVVPTCKTDLRLSGAVYDTNHPERSFALVQYPKDMRAGVVRVGSTLGTYELIAIEPRGILLRSAAGECWLRLVGDPVARAKQPAAPPRREKASRKPQQKNKSSVVVIGHR